MLPGALVRFRREIRVYELALRHPQTPRFARWLLWAAIAYSLSTLCMSMPTSMYGVS